MKVQLPYGPKETNSFPAETGRVLPVNHQKRSLTKPTPQQKARPKWLSTRMAEFEQSCALFQEKVKLFSSTWKPDSN